MREELPKYTADTKRDFTRNRKLPFETLCRTILSMSGQSLNVELQRQFHYDPAVATASAFVQQRGKILPTAFEEILRRFTYQNRPKRRWNGYTLLAADGSHVQIPSDIHDEATYFNSTRDGRGYNLLHFRFFRGGNSALLSCPLFCCMRLLRETLNKTANSSDSLKAGQNIPRSRQILTRSAGFFH